MQTTAQLWLVYKLTNSAALLGVFGFANQVPILFLAALGGYIGDRYNRHHGVIWTQTVSMVLAFVLAGLTFANIIQVWELIFIAFLVGGRECVRCADSAGVSGGDGGAKKICRMRLR